MGLITSVAVVLFSLALSFAKDCYDWRDLQLTTCINVVHPVYLPHTLNVHQNEQIVSSIISEIDNGASVSPYCLLYIKRYLCEYFYPSCTKEDQPLAAPIQVKPCIQICFDVRLACQQYIDHISQVHQHYFNCSKADQSGDPVFTSHSSACSVRNSVVPMDYVVPTDSVVPMESVVTMTPVVPHADENNTTITAGCQVYDPALSPLTNATCAPFVSTQVYYSKSTPYSQLMSDTYANSSIWLISKLAPVIPIGCYKHLLSLLCQTAYPACSRSVDDAGNTVELGIVPCNSFCQTTLQKCEYFFQIVSSQTSLNCSATRIDGSLLWPNGSTTMCTTSLFPPNASSPSFSLPPVDKCPSVLAKVPHPSDRETQCWLPCPDPTYSMDMWHQLNTICLVFASISFTGVAFLVLSTLLSAKKRHRHIHLSIYCSCLLQSISFFISGTHPENGVWCNDAVTYATSSSNAACGTQAYLFHMFTLACLFWWLVMSFHMYSNIVLEKRLNLQKLEIRYHIFAWGVPFILTTITAATNNHAFGPPNPWCYIHPESYVHTYASTFHDPAGIPMVYYVFYIPFGLCMLLAFIMLCGVFYRIFSILKAARSFRNITRADLDVQYRILIFVVVLFVVFVVLFEYRFQLQGEDIKAMKLNDLQYIICQVQNDLGVHFDPSCLKKELPFRINFIHSCVITFIASSTGLFVFIAFGTEYSIYQWWHHLFTLRSVRDVKQFIKDGDPGDRRQMQMSPSLSNFSPPAFSGNDLGSSSGDIPMKNLL